MSTFTQRLPTVTVTIDASLLCWGPHLDTHPVQGRWSPNKTTLHINLLELRAVRNACLHFLPLIRSRCIKIMTYDLTHMFYINREVRSPSSYAEAVRLWNWCIDNHIHVSAVYLPSIQCTNADALRRHFFPGLQMGAGRLDS